MYLPSLALTALCLISASCQTTTAPQPTDRFTAADTNKDGKLSLDEVNTYHVTKMFNSRDANHDGELTKQEWAVEGAAAHDRKFNELDTDHDGIVTLPEALAYGRKDGTAAKIVKAADADHDGQLSREELQAYYAKREGPWN